MPEASGSPNAESEAISLARAGGPAALRTLFLQHRPRLLRMVEMRLDHRLHFGDSGPSMVLDQALLDAEERISEFAGDGKLTLFLWLRQIVAARLAGTHREQLGKTGVQDISLSRPEEPPASSAALAAHLLGKTPIPGEAHAKRLVRLEKALNGLEPLDRDILSLRHFEELTREEAAAALDLEGPVAARRYIRALKRLNEALAEAAQRKAH